MQEIQFVEFWVDVMQANSNFHAFYGNQLVVKYVLNYYKFNITFGFSMVMVKF